MMFLKSKLPNLQENVSLANHTTFRIGGAAKYFAAVKNREELVGAIRAARENDIPFYVLGGGSNLLVADEGFDGLVIKVQSLKFKVQSDNSKCKIEVEAGVPLIKIILETAKKGFSGAEWGFGIPGTIGGAIRGNAGRLGQDISRVVESVRVLNNNLDEKEISAAECEFGYRESRFKKTGEIILDATLVFEKKDKSLIERVLNEAKEIIKHSPPFPSAGCIFKNYEVRKSDPLLKEHPELNERVRGGHAERGQSPAQLGGKIGVGYLIDQCGLKGKKIGGAQIWSGHANYIINTGGATAKEVLALIDLCKKEIKAKYNINLEEEIRFLGINN